ncbi:MAG TPA: iron-sulfur cluster repair di-iron protein [Chitinophagaceae bacterium]
MSNFKDMTLAQIVTSDYRTASVFEKYGLDYCCRGKQTLQHSCEEFKLSVDKLISELKAVSSGSKPAVDFSNMSLSDLIDHIIRSHHEYVKAEMPYLLAYLHKVAMKHGERHPEMVNVYEAFAYLKEEMENHMAKEEEILFPQIRSLENQENSFRKEYLQSPISSMLLEHSAAGSLMQEIKRLTGNYKPPMDACTTYRLSLASLNAFELDFHQHVHLENNILFPKALQLFRHLHETALN